VTLLLHALALAYPPRARRPSAIPTVPPCQIHGCGFLFASPRVTASALREETRRNVSPGICQGRATRLPLMMLCAFFGDDRVCELAYGSVPTVCDGTISNPQARVKMLHGTEPAICARATAVIDVRNVHCAVISSVRHPHAQEEGGCISTFVKATMMPTKSNVNPHHPASCKRVEYIQNTSVWSRAEWDTPYVGGLEM
jgi:hypothetical protein